MKDKRFTDLICKGFCRFHKEGVEELHCGSYAFLRNNLSLGELSAITEKANPIPDFSEDRLIKSVACERCDFIREGCGYREGLSSPPCGGYAVLEHIFKSNKY